MNEDRWLVIDRIRESGKWMEFWFSNWEKSEHDGTFHQCCKTYMFQLLIDDAGLNEQVMNTGVVGLAVKWKGDRPVEIAKTNADFLVHIKNLTVAQLKKWEEFQQSLNP